MQLVFLTYLNRSGSTYLSSQLDQLSSVHVTIEGGIPDGLLVPWRQVESIGQIPDFVQRILQTGKLCSWGIDDRELIARLQQCKLPLTFPDLLQTVIEASVAPHDPEIVIYKRGRYCECIPALRTRIPNCRFIHVVRDVRAIYNSQKRSLSSSGHRMANNPIAVAKYFTRTQRNIEKHRDGDWLHVVRYEDLISDVDTELEKIANFLGISSHRRTDSNYSSRIPNRQSHLHTKILEPADHSRTTAWANELTTDEIYALEYYSGGSLEAQNYRTEIDRPSIHERRKLIEFQIGHYLQRSLALIGKAMSR